MLTEGVRVHCLGFHPSERTELRLGEWADEILAEAPTGACVKAILSRHGREYHCEVKIFSRAGSFHVMSAGPNLYTVTRDAMKRMRRQFKKWHTMRRHAHYEHAEQTNPQNRAG